MTNKYLLFSCLFLILLIPSNANAKIDIELSYLSTSTTYNYFSLPNEDETNRIDINEKKSINAYRLFIEKHFKNSSYTFLYAPLEINYSQVAAKDFKFNQTNFSKNLQTGIKYVFNSYRLGYRRINQFGRNRWYWGGLIKVRDAEICVSQENKSDCYDNVGPVPLLNVGFDLNGDLLYSKVNIDGLFSSKGSAYDANVELGINLDIFSIGLGARILGGGANNEKLINFGQFRSIYVNLTI